MIWVGQFGVAGGQAREDTPWIGIYQDDDTAEDKSDLYVLVEPALPGSEEFCDEMKESIGDIFHDTKASLTGGILRALRSAHENLRDWNKRSLKEHRVAAGVTCLALHGQDAFLAQVGPSRAVYAREGRIEVLAPSVPESVEALGIEEDFYPDFRQFGLIPGDRLLLISPGFSDTLSERDLASVLSLDGEEALPELYRRSRGLENCAALLITSGPPQFVDAN